MGVLQFHTSASAVVEFLQEHVGVVTVCAGTSRGRGQCFCTGRWV